MSSSLRGWVLMFVLSTSIKKKIPNAVSTAQLLSSTHSVGTWSNHEDNCEDSSCVTCKRGFYGQGSCNMTCNQHCMLGYCNSSTGVCKYGCVNTSDYSLTSPWYGPSCNESCTSNCSQGRCFRNGTCYLGCKNGTYGEKCELACPKNCNQNCKTIGGECDDGCKSGFYGKYCNRSCSMNCLGGGCQQNGKCYNCTEGFHGDTCREACPKQCMSCLQYGDSCTGCKDGRYGHRCIVCDNCKGKCRFHDGRCTYGCKDGYYGDHCNVSCNSGCQSSVCDQSTGECSLGCTPTMYGRSCDQTCSRNCMEGQCHNRSGMECSIGCRAGFWGQYCERPCSRACLRCNRSSGSCTDCTKGTYGRHCEKNCSMNCLGRKCNISGTCVSGCVSSYYGNNCSFRCSKHCSTCDQKSGTCSKCVTGWTGEQCKGSTKTVVFYALMSLLLVSVVVTVILLAVKCRTPRGEEKSNKGCCRCCKNTQSTHYSFDIRPRQASYAYEESDPIDTGDEEIALYLTGAGDNGTSDAGPQWNDICGRVSSATTSTDLDNLADNSLSRLLVSSAARTSSSIVNIREDKSNQTQFDSQSFSDYVLGLKRQSGFYKQFKGLPGGELAVCWESKTTTNLPKNRYVNILPYDHSRVKLQTENCEKGKDYINASFIHGYGKRRFFIASQGPLVDTIPDFWNMVLQAETSTVVMLTNLLENGRVMCSQYWPDLECFDQYGDLRVKNVKEVTRADYTVRTFSISKHGKDPNMLTHYQYTAWPDYGQPVDTQSLLNFYTEVKVAHCAGSVVVHCSTGVGRTGTFIALDYLLDQASAEGVVDVFECVKKLRYQRMKMVHHQVEYELLHDVLALALQSMSPELKSTEDNPRCQNVT